jgi:hypothetical protein
MHRAVICISWPVTRRALYGTVLFDSWDKAWLSSPNDRNVEHLNYRYTFILVNASLRRSDHLKTAGTGLLG